MKIGNSIFRHNEAKDTSCGNLSMISDRMYNYYYSINYNGGAIFGSLSQLTIFNSLFEHNVANTVGGALCVQCEDSAIECCKFYNNTAGEYGGAIEAFGTYRIFNTEILNNNAKNGGAIKYTSYNSYGHLQEMMSLFNVTVTGNKALSSGGAFITQVANFAITNSNIYDNSAPYGNTFYGKYGYDSSSNIDARNNWWGSVDGPDDSVWNSANSKFKNWLNEKVNWHVPHVSGGSSNNDESGIGNQNNGVNSYIPSSVSTGSGVHTGSTLTNNVKSSGASSKGFSFTGNWPSGTANGFNNGGSGKSNNVNSKDNSGNSRTSIAGNVKNLNSVSKINSSNVNNLFSVGMDANAADSSASSASSYQGGADESFSNAYEIINEVKKENNQKFSIFNILLIIAWIFFVVGFYRKYNDNEKEI